MAAFAASSSMARLRPTAVRPGMGGRAVAVAPKALFGGLFGGGKKEAASADAAPDYRICVDCGWITDDYQRGMKCPVCTSKNFKGFKGMVRGGRINNAPKEMQARMKARQW